MTFSFLLLWRGFFIPETKPLNRWFCVGTEFLHFSHIRLHLVIFRLIYRVRVDVCTLEHVHCRPAAFFVCSCSGSNSSSISCWWTLGKSSGKILNLYDLAKRRTVARYDAFCYRVWTNLFNFCPHYLMITTHAFEVKRKFSYHNRCLFYTRVSRGIRLEMQNRLDFFCICVLRS